MVVIPSTLSRLPPTFAKDGETVASEAFFGSYLPAPGPNEKDSSCTDSGPLFLRSATERTENQAMGRSARGTSGKSELGRLPRRTSKQLHQRLEEQRISVSLYVTPFSSNFRALVLFFSYGMHLRSAATSFFHFQTCHFSSSRGPR